MKITLRLFAGAALYAACSSWSGAVTMAIDSLNGAVTTNEISAFKTYMAATTIATNNSGNAWLFGSTGKECAAMALMYETTGDTAILDRMIQYADTALAGRNNPTTGVLMWTGKRELAWPNSFTEPVYTSCESGEVVNHILGCAKAILKTPSLWNTTVSVGDPNGYGTTYKARALTYLTECDKTIDTFIIPYWVSSANGNKIYAPSDWSGDGGAAGGPVAWNRISMFLAGLQRSSECHELLGDNPARVVQMDSIVTANVNWFLSCCVAYTASGYNCYNWFYRADTTTKYEEVWEDHGALDIRMLWQAYDRGIGLSKIEMTKFANTLQYSVWNGSVFHGRWDGQDGSYGTKTYTKGAYLYLAEFAPAVYTTVAAADQSHTSDPSMVAPILWAKNRRYQQFALYSAATKGATGAGDDNAASFLVACTPLGGTSSNVALSASGLPTGVTATFSSTTISGGSGSATVTLAASYATAPGTYSVTITGNNGSTTQTTSLALTVLANLALGKTATSSSDYSSSYNAAKAIDGSDSTRWSTVNGLTTNQWLAIDFGASTTFNRVLLKEISYNRITSFKLQSSTDGSTYTDIPGTSGTTVGAAKTVSFADVTARFLRLYVLTSSAAPTVNEICVFADPNLAPAALAAASTEWSSTYAAGMANDASDTTRWSAASGQTADQWISLSFGPEKSFSRVVLREIYAARVTSYKLQSSADGVTYTDIAGTSDSSIGSLKFVAFTKTTAPFLRLYLTTASNVPTINEIAVY